MYLDGVKPGGVTQLHFHPGQPHIIFAASRRSGYIQKWDLRNPSVPLEHAMFRGAHKTSGTNQRMNFDVDLGGQFLAAGNEVSSSSVTLRQYDPLMVRSWATQSGSVSLFNASPASETTDACLAFQAHDGAFQSVDAESLTHSSTQTRSARCHSTPYILYFSLYLAPAISTECSKPRF